MTSTSANAFSKSRRDERPDLLRLQVVGVVVARGEDEGAEQDAPLHLRAEARVARRAVHRAEVPLAARAGRLHAQAVAHAVEAREVAGGLGRWR